MNFEFIDLDRVFTPNLEVQWQAALKSIPEDARQFKFNERAFGYLALHDLIIRNKMTQYESLTEELRLGHRKIVMSALRTYLIVQRICELYKTQAVVHYNEWAMALAANWAATDCGVRAITASNLLADRRYPSLFAHTIIEQRWRELKKWEHWEDISLPRERVEMVIENMLSRMSGPTTHSLSPQKTFGEGLSTGRSDKKLIVAYTSSGHEQLASTPVRLSINQPPLLFSGPFQTQSDWLKSLLSFIEKRDDMELIVRVHPSEVQGSESDHHQQLRHTFSRPFKNCKFVWAFDNISSYDLAERADLVTVAWSTIGTELAAMGVPVLAAFRATHPWPDKGLIHFDNDTQGYFRKLVSLSRNAKTTLEEIIKAFRWFHFNFYTAVVDLKTIFPSRGSFFPCSDWAPNLKHSFRRVFDGHSLTEDTLRIFSERQSQQTSDEEKKAVLQGLSDIISYCSVGNARLNYSELGLERQNDHTVTFRFGTETVMRYSPLLSRISQIYEASVSPDHKDGVIRRASSIAQSA